MRAYFVVWINANLLSKFLAADKKILQLSSTIINEHETLKDAGESRNSKNCVSRAYCLRFIVTHSHEIKIS